MTIRKTGSRKTDRQPQRTSRRSGRPVVILDMDETLLHSTVTRDGVIAKARPGVLSFLEQLSDMGFRLVVFSAGAPDYIPLALRSAGLSGRLRTWRSSRERNDWSMLEGRPWVLVDNETFSSDIVQTKLKQLGDVRRVRHVRVSSFFGDGRDRVLRGLAADVAERLAEVADG